MKTYRNAATALMLTVAFSTSAWAGEIQTGIAAPQPAPAASGEIQTGATEGEMHTGEAASTPGTADTMTAAALNLLQSVLTLL